MMQNIEIKASVNDLESLKEKVKKLSHSDGELIEQEDIFFPTSKGRLKLRKFNDGKGQLIAYERPDVSGPKTSEYEIAEVMNAQTLQNVLSRSLGVLTVVRKKRHLYLIGQTRVHLDVVENLGDFMELEVVMEKGQAVEDGEKIAKELMASLNISENNLISGAYADLLEKKKCLLKEGM